MTVHREKFATQVDKVLLADLRKLAKSEGRQIQALIEEAIQKLLDDKDSNQPSREIMEIADGITKKYSKTLELLAK